MDKSVAVIKYKKYRGTYRKFLRITFNSAKAGVTRTSITQNSDFNFLYSTIAPPDIKEKVDFFDFT